MKKLNNKGEAVLAILGVGMIWGFITTLFVQQVRKDHAESVPTHLTR